MRFQTMTLASENSGKTILLLRAKERPLSEPRHIQGLKVTCWRDSCKTRAVRACLHGVGDPGVVG